MYDLIAFSLTLVFLFWAFIMIYNVTRIIFTAIKETIKEWRND